MADSDAVTAVPAAQTFTLYEVQKCLNSVIEVVFKMCYLFINLAGYLWIFLSIDVSYSLHKGPSKSLCRDWYSSDLIFPSAKISAFLWTEIWAQEHQGSSDGLHCVSSAKLRGRAYCAQTCPMVWVQPPGVLNAHQALICIHILLKVLDFQVRICGFLSRSFHEAVFHGQHLVHYQ